MIFGKFHARGLCDLEVLVHSKSNVIAVCCCLNVGVCIEISSGILDSEKKNGPRWKRINFDPLVEGTHIIRVAWDGDANVKFNVLRADGTRLNSKNVRGSNPGIWSGKLDANEQYYIGLWSANGIANYTASIELEMVDVEPAPPVTALNLGEGVLDSQKVVGPRFIRLDFDAIASAIHTITVSWDSDADVKYNVLRADGTRLNSRNIRGSNPGVWSGELDANEQYYIGLWSASGITNYAAEVRVPPGSDTGVPVVDMSNLPPIANAGTDITIVQGAELTLDGTGSSDADGVISSYVWSIGTEVISTQSVYTTSNIVVGNYSVKLEVTDDSNSKDVDFMTLKVVEDVEVNLPPVAEDLNVTSLEDTAVVLDLVATDANSNSPLLYSIETSPINGEITLINSEFVYTPNPNFFGVDTLTFKANDGEFDSNIAKVTITVESNIFIFEGDTVVINGAESTDDGGIVSYLWSLNDQFIGSTPTVAIDEFLLGDNVVQLRVIDDAGLDDIDTVIVTVTARQEPDTGSPGIFTSDVRGSTTTVNASAEFDVVLSSEPTDLVTIPIYSSDVTEGEVAVSELVFSSTNWDSPQTVTIFGRNDSVTDGIQDYSIVLSPAVSNDPSYSGLDPDDVAIQGVQLALLELEQNMLIQGIPVGISIPIRYIGNNPLRFSFSPEYPGIRYSSTSGSFFYDGSDSTPAQFNIEVVVTDGVVSTRRTLDINVVASPEVNLIIDGEYHVAENQVVRFGLQKGLAGIDILPSEVNLKASFSGFDHLPPPPADVQPLSPIFRLSAADGDYSISALWPVDLVDTRSIINRATLFRYSTEYGWDPGSSFPESRIINGREWFELGHAVRDTPIFIGIGPDRADPNRPLPNLSGNRINERAQTRARVVPPAIPLEAIECDLAGFDKPETGSFQGNFTCRYESFKVSITNFLYDSFGNSTMWSGSTSVKEFAS